MSLFFLCVYCGISPKDFSKRTCNAWNVKPGRNDYTVGLHASNRKAFKAWVESARKKGPLFEYKKHANGSFKYVLQFIKTQ